MWLHLHQHLQQHQRTGTHNGIQSATLWIYESTPWHAYSPGQLALSEISGHSQEVSKSQETFPTYCLHLTILFNRRTWPDGANPCALYKLRCKLRAHLQDRNKCWRPKPLLKETKRKNYFSFTQLLSGRSSKSGQGQWLLEDGYPRSPIHDCRQSRSLMIPLSTRKREVLCAKWHKCNQPHCRIA